MPQDLTQNTKPTESTAAARAPNDSAAGDLQKTKDALVEGAEHLGAELKTAAGDAAGQAKKAAETKLDAGRDFATEHLGAVAHALRKTGDELGKSDNALTPFVGQAASAVENVSSYLQTRTLSQLMGDAESFARREPALFLGGSFLAGIFGGRFLKSASPAGTRRQATHSTHRPALPAYNPSRGAYPSGGAAQSRQPTTGGSAVAGSRAGMTGSRQTANATEAPSFASLATEKPGNAAAGSPTDRKAASPSEAPASGAHPTGSGLTGASDKAAGAGSR